MPTLGAVTPILRIRYREGARILCRLSRFRGRVGTPLRRELSALHRSIARRLFATPQRTSRRRLARIGGSHQGRGHRRVASRVVGKELPLRQARSRNDALENTGSLGGRPVRQSTAFLRGDGGLSAQAEAGGQVTVEPLTAFQLPWPARNPSSHSADRPGSAGRFRLMAGRGRFAGETGVAKAPPTTATGGDDAPIRRGLRPPR